MSTTEGDMERPEGSLKNNINFVEFLDGIEKRLDEGSEERARFKETVNEAETWLKSNPGSLGEVLNVAVCKGGLQFCFQSGIGGHAENVSGTGVGIFTGEPLKEMAPSTQAGSFTLTVTGDGAAEMFLTQTRLGTFPGLPVTEQTWYRKDHCSGLNSGPYKGRWDPM